MSKTPIEFRKLAESPELYDTCEAVGNKFNLHIDQIGEMSAEICDILNGASESKDFTNHIMERLEIDQKLTDAIVVEVNKVVFQALRDKMQGKSSADTISSIESAGGFTIEPQTQIVQTPQTQTEGEKEETLAHIEGSQAFASVHTEPLIDRLLTTSISQTEQKVAQKISIVPPIPGRKLSEALVKAPVSAPVTPKKEDSGPKVDLYREVV